MNDSTHDPAHHQGSDVPLEPGLSITEGQLRIASQELMDRHSEVALLRDEVDAATHELADRQSEIFALRAELLYWQERVCTLAHCDQSPAFDVDAKQGADAEAEHLRQQLVWMRRSPFWRARDLVIAALRRSGLRTRE